MHITTVYSLFSGDPRRTQWRTSLRTVSSFPSSSSSAAKLHGACIPAQTAAAGGVSRLAAILDGPDLISPLLLSPRSLSSRFFSSATSPSEDEPYTALKEGLLHNYQLTDYQKIEKLHALDGLESRKPTQLLSEMTELCPQGEQQSKFFAFPFLQRLPNWLRIMLGEDDHQDVRSLAVKANKLQALYGHLQHGTLAAVDSTDSAVNAVKGSTRGRKGVYGRGPVVEAAPNPREAADTVERARVPTAPPAPPPPPGLPRCPGAGLRRSMLLSLDLWRQGHKE
jgi:hypothetical protein